MDNISKLSKCEIMPDSEKVLRKLSTQLMNKYPKQQVEIWEDAVLLALAAGHNQPKASDVSKAVDKHYGHKPVNKKKGEGSDWDKGYEAGRKAGETQFKFVQITKSIEFTSEEIKCLKAMHRNYIKTVHPDHGGSHEDMVTINSVMEKLKGSI